MRNHLAFDWCNVDLFFQIASIVGFVVSGMLIGFGFGRKYENHIMTGIAAAMVHEMPLRFQAEFFAVGLKKYRKLDDEQVHKELKKIFAIRGIDYDQFKEPIK